MPTLAWRKLHKALGLYSEYNNRRHPTSKIRCWFHLNYAKQYQNRKNYYAINKSRCDSLPSHW